MHPEVENMTASQQKEIEILTKEFAAIKRERTIRLIQKWRNPDGSRKRIERR